MFNWTTTTILNSLKDFTTGNDLVKVFTEGFANASSTNPVLKIKRDHTFEARYITSIYKAYASDPTLCELTVDCAALKTKIDELNAGGSYPVHVRLSFYVALEGSEESIYANDGYQKGKPFSVGFDVTSTNTGAEIAEKIKKNAEKYGVIMYGKKIFDLSVSEAVLTIKGTHEYQRFKNAFAAMDDVIEEDLIDFLEDGETTSEAGVFTLVKRGTNGFGTSHQLIKDLRLPTAHNTKWLALKEDEKVAVGAKYNQYIINYCAPSMANPGFGVIGQHENSVTTHVFWVNQAIDDEFKAYFTSLKVEPTEVTNADGTAKNTNDSGTPTTKATADAGKNYSENHEQSETVSHKKATTTI